MVTGYIPAGSVEELDPQLNRLVMAEDHRQKSKIILIPSESIAPPAVRALMSSNFGVAKSAHWKWPGLLILWPGVN